MIRKSEWINKVYCDMTTIYINFANVVPRRITFFICSVLHCIVVWRSQWYCDKEKVKKNEALLHMSFYRFLYIVYIVLRDCPTWNCGAWRRTLRAPIPRLAKSSLRMGALFSFWDPAECEGCRTGSIDFFSLQGNVDVSLLDALQRYINLVPCVHHSLNLRLVIFYMKI